ncbi:MAG TPA: RagB/SusD family nutrient uptake outer membrane protein [Pelobium sp.]
MKKISLFVFIIAALSSSCTKEFLDKAPISNISTNNFYKTADDITTAVNGAYAALKLNGQYQYYYTYGELSTDNILNVGGVQDQKDFGLFNLQPANSYIAAAWADNYNGISRCNTILNRIDAVPMDADLKSRYIGEVKFLRALMYFNLVRYFGDVPLVLTEITSPNQGYDYARVPKADVYAQIIKDLNDADAALPAPPYNAADLGRATKGAAKAILGKVYLTQRNFSAAATKLKEVIDLNVYDLMPNYADVFKAATENGKEMIFSVQYKSGLGGQGSPFSNYYAPPGSGTYVSISPPLGNVIVNDDIFNAYESGDTRKAASVSKTYIGAGGATVTLPNAFSKKFPDPSATQYDSDNNWIVIRYADVLLMYAEALNEVSYQANGDAFFYYNKVRTRAIPGGAKTATDLPDQGSFRLAIEAERRVELAFEGHRWFDLLRTNRALTILNAKAAALNILGNDASGKIDSHNLLFPIPQDQVRISNGKITQNPGYPN